MTDQAITLEIRGATLLAVPAIHFRLPFAEAVNALCCDPRTRPDAVAVELGPAAAAAVRVWLRELGIGPAQRRRLPCMLGLHCARRSIHPSKRARALALQRDTATELHRLPPWVLSEELGFRGLAALQLSPTDSMVEALRCACELDIPVYGVDLEDSAGLELPRRLIEDPWSARGMVRVYAETNARRARMDIDPIINGRRETVMAARLAALLTRHRRLLFSCGLGHWNRLASLLRDPALRPATVGPEPDEADLLTWRRTLIHPGIAVQAMEWPAVTWRWERSRRHPLLGDDGRTPRHEPHQALLAKALEHAYRCAPGLTDAERQGAAQHSARFIQMLQAEALLRLLGVPDLGLLLQCAEATLPRAVVGALGRILMRFPWAKQSTFTDVDLLRSSASGIPGEVVVTGRSGGERVSLAQGGEPLVPDPRLIQAAETLRRTGQSSGSARWPCHYSWRPWERLATALCAKASGQVEVTRRVRVTEPFAGQLLDGIDVKMTLREYARGRDRLNVRDTRLAKGCASRAIIDAFPVVWLFSSSAHRHGRLQSLRTPLDPLLDAARDRTPLESLREGPDADLLDILMYTEGEERWTPYPPSHGILEYSTHGWVLFRPQCPTLRQAADWILQTRTRLRPSYTNPIDGGLPHEVRASLQCDGGPALAELSWQDTLLRIALAFGGRAVTLVAPEEFSPAPSILAYARQRSQSIGRISIATFSPDHVARIRLIHLVSGFIQGQEGRVHYQGRPAEAMGESEDAYRELVPAEWRRFLW